MDLERFVDKKERSMCLGKLYIYGFASDPFMLVNKCGAYNSFV